MECFTHNAAVAVGVCKTCGRAVCRSCAIDSGMFVTCSDACTREAIDLHEMNQRGKKIYGIGVPKKVPSGVIMWVLFGALFGGFGIYQSYRHDQMDWFLLLFGALSFVIAFIAYRRTKEVGLQC